MITKRLLQRLFVFLISAGAVLPLSAWTQPTPEKGRVLDSIRTARKQKILDFTDSRYPIGYNIDTLKNIPTELRGENLSKGLTQTDPVEAAYEFLELNKEIFGIKNVREELKVEGQSFKEYGGLIVLKQFYGGVPVSGSEIIARFSRSKKLYAIEAALQPEMEIKMTVATFPSIDSLSAIEVTKRDLNYTAENEKLAWEYIESLGNKNLKPFSATKSIIIFKEKFYLCWKVLISRFQPDESWLYFIDAHTGTILFREDQIYREHHRPSTGTPKK